MKSEEDAAAAAAMDEDRLVHAVRVAAAVAVLAPRAAAARTLARKAACSMVAFERRLKQETHDHGQQRRSALELAIRLSSRLRRLSSAAVSMATTHCDQCCKRTGGAAQAVQQRTRSYGRLRLAVPRDHSSLQSCIRETR